MPRPKEGAEIVSVEYRRLKEEYDRVDEAEAAADAERWIRGAVRVVEPTREEVVRSSRLYLAMRRLMKQEGALAVTIDCLGGFRRQELPAYPCLGFCRLNDRRRVGACEADLNSMLTMLLFAHAFGVPGFISDPVIDTSANEVIHAHCVSPTRMDGPAGPPLPYLIRSHMEDDRGAALQVRHRVGETITSAKIVNFATVLISTGKITANVDSDRGCRTKIATKVPRARTLLDNYGSGLHRVIFYGDRREGVGHLAALLGLKIVEEA